jgi:hypothetical protein
MFSLHRHDLHKGNPRACRGIGVGSGDAGETPCSRIGVNLRGRWTEAVRAS